MRDRVAPSLFALNAPHYGRIAKVRCRCGADLAWKQSGEDFDCDACGEVTLRREGEGWRAVRPAPRRVRMAECQACGFRFPWQRRRPEDEHALQCCTNCLLVMPGGATRSWLTEPEPAFSLT